VKRSTNLRTARRAVPLL